MIDLWAVAAPTGALEMRGTRDGLEALAAVLLRPTGRVRLHDPPSIPPGEEAVRSIEVQSADDPDANIELTVAAGALAVTGGESKRRLLAQSLRNLGSTAPQVSPGAVATHLDFAYFPGHPFLADSPHWITAFIVSHL